MAREKKALVYSMYSVTCMALLGFFFSIPLLAACGTMCSIINGVGLIINENKA
ncbi:MAG: hypothetical protein ACRCWY_10150 [Cellulosilyticaceae bacterium]